MRAPPTAVLLAALLALLLSPSPAAARHAEGDIVALTGIVTDRQGAPLQQLTVVLEASRTGLDLRRLTRQKQATQRLTTLTNERGEYSLEWPWSGYYNRLEVSAAVPVRKSDGEKLEELVRLDVTRRVAQSGAGVPVVAALTVEDTSFLDALRAFVASIATDDERQVYAGMGKPDTVDTVGYPGYRESSWWYFEAGKVYRFRDGRLLQVVPFDPIRRF